MRGAGGRQADHRLLATAKDDTLSRITPMLLEGSGVVTTRNDVHYVATEYGVA